MIESITQVKPIVYKFVDGAEFSGLAKQGNVIEQISPFADITAENENILIRNIGTNTVLGLINQIGTFITCIHDNLGKEFQILADKFRNNSGPFMAINEFKNNSRAFMIGGWRGDEIGKKLFLEGDSLLRAAGIQTMSTWGQEMGRWTDLLYNPLEKVCYICKPIGGDDIIRVKGKRTITPSVYATTPEQVRNAYDYVDHGAPGHKIDYSS